MNWKAQVGCCVIIMHEMLQQLAGMGLNLAAGALLKRQAEEGGKGPGTPVDDEGNTHLHILARDNGDPGLFRGIVSAGVDVNQTNKNLDTPLHVAAKAGHVQ
eukprot:scaffold240063_cov27-Prasinocladus_malaysianus.AAC.1